MAAIFKYDGKLFQAADLKKKLKRLKISEADIEILLEGDYSKGDLEKEFNRLNVPKKEEILDNSEITLYKYSNGTDIIVSVYSPKEEKYPDYHLIEIKKYLV